jgi:hypothetical protein
MPWRPDTLAEVARRVNAGEREDYALSEFLDDFYMRLRRHEFAAAQASIDGEPEAVSCPKCHAHLGAVGEHLALRWGLKTPAWTNDPSRFLKRPYFTTPLEGFKAMLIAESPLAFRRRLIFTEAEPLRRARFPRAPDGRALEAHELLTLASPNQSAARALRRERLAARAAANGKIAT